MHGAKVKKRPCSIFIGRYTYMPMKMEQSVPKRRHIKFRRRRITQKKTYNIRNTAKVWNHEQNVTAAGSSDKFGIVYSTTQRKSRGWVVCGMKDKCRLQKNKYYSLLVITELRCFDWTKNIQNCICFIELTFYLPNISFTDDVTR
jgi:hypothetical protein